MLEIFQRMMIILNKIKSTFDDLIQIIVESNKGRINHFILTPDQLKDNLRLIMANLNENEICYHE